MHARSASDIALVVKPTNTAPVQRVLHAISEKIREAAGQGLWRVHIRIADDMVKPVMEELIKEGHKVQSAEVDFSGYFKEFHAEIFWGPPEEHKEI